MSDQPQTFVVNYGTPEEAKEGANAGFEPPEESGDYRLRITGFRSAPVKDSVVQRCVVNMRAVSKPDGEAAGGFCEYMWFNIPAGKEEEFKKFNPNRQKFLARSFLSAIGVDLSERDAKSKTTAKVNPEQWKGIELWGYVQVKLDKWTDADGNPQERKKGEIREIFTNAEFAKRHNQPMEEESPLDGKANDDDEVIPARG